MQVQIPQLAEDSMTVSSLPTSRSSNHPATLLSIVVATAVPLGLAVTVAALTVLVGPGA